MLVATYDRNSRLNVRREPGGEVVATLERRQAVPVESIEDGWCKVPGGYVRADLVVIGELEDRQAAQSQDEAPGQPEEDGWQGELSGMSINELRALAKGSGVTLPKNATKAQIIGLLLDE